MKKPKNYISEEGSMNYELLLASEGKNFNNWMYSKMKPYLNGSVLETGSGCGNFSEKIIHDFPGPIYLTEIDPVFIKHLRNRFNNKKVHVKKLDLNSRKDFSKIKVQFDSIYSSNVLEHVKNDVLALKMIRSKLKPGGVLAILVPAHKFLFSPLDVAEGHYRRYTKEEIENKCEIAGFRIIKSFWFNFFAIPGRFVDGNLFKSRKTHGPAFRLFNTLIPFLRFVEEKIFLNFTGVSRIVIAENPSRE